MKSVDYMQRKQNRNVVAMSIYGSQSSALRKKKTPLFNEDLFDFQEKVDEATILSQTPQTHKINNKQKLGNF